MDGSVRERLGERVVDEPVLLDEREALEARSVATVTWKWSPPPVRSSTVELTRFRKCAAQQRLEGLDGLMVSS